LPSGRKREKERLTLNTDKISREKNSLKTYLKTEPFAWLILMQAKVSKEGSVITN